VFDFAPLSSQTGCAVEDLETTSSTKEFHWLHEGHLPIHLADSCPQFWQKKEDLTLAN